jgi:enamine deaminase RidA (YjgF/YER057c/UK114 family)
LRSFSAEREYFEILPARSTVKAAELLMGARVEIEAVAIRRSCL